MHVREPHPTAFDLRLRVGSIPVRVNPTFWIAAALLGIRYYADPEQGGIGFFLFWIAGAFVSLLLHELAHAAVVRAFGAPAEAVLGGLGGVTAAIGTLDSRGRRLVAIVAGFVPQVGIIALVWILTLLPFPQVLVERGWAAPIATALAMLVWINYYWALLNLLPLWPFDGGQFTGEVAEALLGRRGRTLALVLSLIVAAILAVGVAFQLTLHLDDRFNPRYVLYLQADAVHLIFCFLLWLQSFQALWLNADRADVARGTEELGPGAVPTPGGDPR
jgi:stage IV sporulation protein FB